jgi:hypothetical protein
MLLKFLQWCRNQCAFFPIKIMPFILNSLHTANLPYCSLVWYLTPNNKQCNRSNSSVFSDTGKEWTVTCSRSQLLCCHATIEENIVSSTSASFSDWTRLMAKPKMTIITTVATQTNPKILLLQAVYIQQRDHCSLSNPTSRNCGRKFLKQLYYWC